MAFLVEEDVVRLQVPAPCKSRQTASTAVELVELGSPPMTYLSLVQVADGQRLERVGVAQSSSKAFRS